MQQRYQCPRCGAQVAFGVRFCGNCRTQLNWPAQPPQYQQQYQQPPQYQQQYQQQPGGSYQQQPEPPKKKSGKLGIILLAVILLALAAVGSCVVCAMQPESSESPAPSGDTINAIIQNELGTTCNREGIEKIAGIDTVNTGYGYNIDIHFAIDDNLSEGFIKGGAQMDVFDTMEALYTSEYDIQWVDMYGTFSMVDEYGNASEIEVLHARLGRDTARKINWDNMTREMLFDILDFLQWHPAFQAIN